MKLSLEASPEISAGSNRFKSLIEETSNPQRGDLLLNEKVINVKGANLKDEDIGILVQNLQYQALNLDKFDISYNQLGNQAVENLFYTFRLGSSTSLCNIRFIDFSNNKIGDDGAKYTASHLSNGLHPHLTCLNLSSNSITDNGEGYIVAALKSARVQNMIVLVQRLKQSSKLIPGIGTKEEKVTMYREYLKEGIKKGTNNQAIVVDKSFWGEIKHKGNQVKAAGIGLAGFIKCNWQPHEVIKEHTQEKLIAKVSETVAKTLGKFNFINGVVSCYLHSIDEMYFSETGQEVITHKLQAIGEQEFSNNY